MTGLVDSHIVVRRDNFGLDVRLSIAEGEAVALLGPNGAGKTTALRALAGLLPITGGEITLAGEKLDAPGQAAWKPPEDRSVGVVFQDYLLFPHMTALDNVAFGPRRLGQPRAAARAVAAAWLNRMGLAEYGATKPAQLSGGQAQRVALARALAPDPRLLLLDEPLAALDARARLDTRGQLHQHLSEQPGATLLVTHDPLDALVLADRIVIIENGRVVQEGDAATITARPRSDYVARLVGLNLYRGHGDGHTVRLESEFAFTVAERVSGDSFVAFAPSAVVLHSTHPRDSSQNNWAATVAGIQRHGDNLRVQLRGRVEAAADVTPLAAAQLNLAPGQEVWATVKATATQVYPAH